MNTQYNFPISCSTARNCDVRTISDESVGTIEDIILDTESGEVAYVVLSIDEGFLNLGSKLLALPWQAFDFHGHQRDIILINVDKEKLENAPGFDKDDWPLGPQHEFINNIHMHYGLGRRRAMIE
ncbi:PRC-barrel domain-containing protein [Algoriphagus sp.]|uniref:PRC-barrel domain-containing protein n=1 Tax=Algoriphagus sp. TaxID=1872435 RepID=UPI003F70913B